MSNNRLRRLGNSFTSLLDSLADARRASATWSRLNAMSDAQLASRGITRADIPRLVSRELGIL